MAFSLARAVCFGADVLASGTSNGNLALWDLAGAASNEGRGSGALPLDMRPVLTLQAMHLSGVNAMHLSSSPGEVL